MFMRKPKIFVYDIRFSLPISCKILLYDITNDKYYHFNNRCAIHEEFWNMRVELINADRKDLIRVCVYPKERWFDRFKKE